MQQEIEEDNSLKKRVDEQIQTRKKIKILATLFVAFLVSCSGENRKEPVDSASKVEANEISDETIEVPKELAPESFIELLDLKNHQTVIDKDKNSKFKFSIDDFLIKLNDNKK